MDQIWATGWSVQILAYRYVYLIKKKLKKVKLLSVVVHAYNLSTQKAEVL
jgi:hypothetical protein